jgi:hypothetical protein
MLSAPGVFSPSRARLALSQTWDSQTLHAASRPRGLCISPNSFVNTLFIKRDPRRTLAFVTRPYAGDLNGMVTPGEIGDLWYGSGGLPPSV